jgi:2-keto-3-deoxy-L-rhamnonate aldolase RhmA
MLKKKLHNNELTLGSWVTIGDESIVEIIAKSGYDWLVIDLEHSSIDIQTAAKLIRIIDLCNVTPLVRLTSNNPDQIKRVMDAGAYGIVVPMVNSRKQAEQAVASTRYGPKGIRGVGLARAQGYGNKFKEYLKWQRDEPIVIVQIEHKDAINNLEEIFTTPGVDGFIIGPYDLSCSLGIPGEFNNKEFIDTVNYIKSIGEKFNCSVGMHIVEPDSSILSKCIDDGYKFIAYSVDIRVIDVGFRLGASYIAR